MSNDPEDPLWVDFSGSSRAVKTFKGRAKYTEYDNVDLASGFPKEEIWTTKDGRRIAVPNMSDDHLLNTIAFLRRNVENYRKALIAQITRRMSAISLVRWIFEPELSYAKENIRFELESLSAEGKRIFHMAPEVLLGNFVPQYKYMLREAYKRKILIESATVDRTREALEGQIAITDSHDTEDNWGSS